MASIAPPASVARPVAPSPVALDQAGAVSTVDLLTTAHRTGVQIFLDGRDFVADPRDWDYTPPSD